MRAVEKIKADTARLNPGEQYELFRWWIESDGFRQRQLASLKQAVATGIDDLENGRYREYSETNLMQLAEDIGQVGTKRK
jgi:predicted XRE-type DNA-binding protein